MRIDACSIAGVHVLRSDRRGDERGSFARWYCDREMEQVLHGAGIVQVNHSHTRERGSIRGMHFQYPPHAEKKIIRCLAGSVFDVALDLRCASPTFLHWFGITLEAGDDSAILIPEGCAHGFQTLTDDAQLLYLHTAHYAAGNEGGVRFDDPRAGIVWPLDPTVVSLRDTSHLLLPDTFSGIEI